MALTIAIKFDDVIYDLQSEIELFFGDVPTKDSTRWYTGLRSGYESGDLFTAGHSIGDVIPDICQAHSDGHRVIIVTARPAYTTQATLDWLHDRAVPYDEFVVCSKPSTVQCDWFIGSTRDLHLFTTGVRPINSPDEAKATTFRYPLDRSEVLTVDDKTGGAKGKKLSQVSLIPPRMLWLLGEIYGRGAAKYQRENWRRGYKWSLSYDALQRHLMAFWMGEDVDSSDQGGDDLPHLLHAMFHCLSLATFADEGLGEDDRPYSTIPGEVEG